MPWHEKCWDVWEEQRGEGGAREESKAGISTVFGAIRRILNRGEPCSDSYFRMFTLLKVCRVQCDRTGSKETLGASVINE